MTQVYILTLPFCGSSHQFDTSALLSLQESHQIIQHTSYMINPAVDDPKLVLVVSCRPKHNTKSLSHLPMSDLPSSHLPMSDLPSSHLSASHLSVSKTSSNESKSRRSRQRELEALLASLSEDDHKKFEILREWRNTLAISQGIPSFEICSNKQLYYLMINPPKTLTDLKQHKGFGKKRLTRFGQILVDYFNNID